VTTELSSQKRLGTALFYGIVALLLYLAFLVLAPFLVPLAWAAVLVTVSYPVFEWLARRWGLTRAALVCTMAVTVILIVPVLFVMVAFVKQGVNAIQEFQFQAAIGNYTRLDKLWTMIQERFPDAGSEDFSHTLQRYGAVAAGFVAGKLGIILKNAAVFFFHLGVTILAIFYFYRDGASMVARLRDLLPFEQEHRERMLSESRELIFASVTSSLAAAMAHAILGGVAFAATGISAPVFWGVMMGFFSFVPLVGSALIWVPIAISLMVGGHIGKGIVLVIVCSVMVTAVDNVVRPWLISGRAELGGLMVFIGVLGGIEAFGLLGVILGPIIMAMAASVLEVYAPTHLHRGNKTVRAGAK
jgi:predicted PurR-regulated permease PerM